MRISEFKGQYWFLSNFYPCTIVFNHNGEEYMVPTLEHAYQMSKTTDQCFLGIMSKTTGPREVREYGQLLPIDESWLGIRRTMMANLVRLKFRQHELLAQRLRETDDAELIDGNHRGDSYWGVNFVTGKGENYLGEILMKVRQEILDKYENTD